MKNLFEYLNFEIIITEIKQSEYKTLYDILFLSIIASLIDLFFLNNHITHYELLCVIRFIYWFFGLLSLYCIRNRYHREKRLEKERIELEKLKKQEQKELTEKFKEHYTKILNSCNNKEIEFLKKFVSSNEAVRTIKYYEMDVIKNLIAKQVDFLQVIDSGFDYDACVSAWGLNFLKEYFKNIENKKINELIRKSLTD